MPSDQGQTDAAADAVPPETASLMIATFADLYRQEIGAEEDVHRTLPFFGTALGIVVGALAYAAGRLPKWTESSGTAEQGALVASAVLLALAVIEAGCVLFWLARAIARRDYQRIGPEDALRTRLAELQEYYDRHDTPPAELDRAMLADMRKVLIQSYVAVTPANRVLNQRRYHYRALASSHLVRSLIWALGATTVIFIADKLGILPRVAP